jgi:hypothetical protein
MICYQVFLEADMDDIEDDPIAGHFTEVLPAVKQAPLDVDEEHALPSEDSILGFVHNTRKRMVKQLTRQGIPEDRDQQAVLLATLKDMSHDAMGRKKIASEERGNANNAASAAIIAKLLTTMPTNVLQGAQPPAADYQPPQLGAEIPRPTLVEGETATHIPQQSYATFMEKFPLPGDSS